MFALLFSKPIVRLIMRLWWLPFPFAVGVWLGMWGSRGGVDWEWLSEGFRIGLKLFFLSAGALYAVDRLLYVGEAVRHCLAGQRFLCPECLRFGPFCFACADCGVEVPFRGACSRALRTCDCRAPASPTTNSRANRSDAFCPHCKSLVDRALYHRRRVRVVGTLYRDDLLRLCEALDVRKPPKADSVCVCDDGACLTYVVPLDALPDTARVAPLDHALRALEAIWLDGAEDPLALGETIDRFLGRSGLSEAERDSITVLVRQTALSPAVDLLLSSRFGMVECRKEAEALLGVGASRRRAIFLRTAELAPGQLAYEWPPSQSEMRELTHRAVLLRAAELSDRHPHLGRSFSRLPRKRHRDRCRDQERH